NAASESSSSSQPSAAQAPCRLRLLSARQSSANEPAKRSTSRPRAARGERRLSRSGPHRPARDALRHRGDAHGQAPGAAGREELVGIDLVGPADEVLLRVVVRRAVDRASLPDLLPLQVVAALERRLALLARRPFQVAAGHGRIVEGWWESRPGRVPTRPLVRPVDRCAQRAETQKALPTLPATGRLRAALTRPKPGGARFADEARDV